MGIGILPMMGIGAGLGLLRSGNVGGALQGAALGGAGGAIGNMLKAGEALKGAEVVSSAAKGVAPFEGAVFNPTTQTWLNPEYYVGTASPLATYTGGEGILSNALGNISSNLPDYVTPQNLLGAANVLSNITPRQQQQISPSPTGGVRQGGSVQTVNYGMAQPIPRRKGIM